ncbi:hypothetical protein SPSYN_00813 [Sporotomaculum syntrophicum]|uniref:Uncharacterized protein n=1 Tax=Sporotomaculum syntrophicum TaxID=182264 RepID=A0A9D2WS18_9FIRM|nr:hypothetical protein [Sporotomaculum syntrophicum]KAF1086075.1 hypothetical protein SPSYN_00813 [Sporotomaculum syntrophicum]
MKIKKIKLIKLEDLYREDMYKDYLVSLNRDRQDYRQSAALPGLSRNKKRTGNCLS